MKCLKESVRKKLYIFQSNFESSRRKRSENSSSFYEILFPSRTITKLKERRASKIDWNCRSFSFVLYTALRISLGKDNKVELMSFSVAHAAF